MQARPRLFVSCPPSGPRIPPPYVKLFRKHCPAESTRIVERPKNQGPEQLHFPYATPMASASGPADARLVEAVEKLGLKLELGKVPQPVLAVESVNEQPTADPPGAAASLPPLPPPQSEVAAIRSE